MFCNVSRKISQKLVLNKIITSLEEELYTYGIQQGLVLLLNIITALLVGFIMGMVWECIIILLTYIPLRTYAGGYHSNSPVRCYIYSLGVIILQLYSITFISSQISMFMISILAGSFIFCFAPVESINKPLTNNERIIYRKKARTILVIEEIIILFSIILRSEKISIIITTTIIVTMIMTVVGKYQVSKMGRV